MKAIIHVTKCIEIEVNTKHPNYQRTLKGYEDSDDFLTGMTPLDRMLCNFELFNFKIHNEFMNVKRISSLDFNTEEMIYQKLEKDVDALQP
jgi:hypothetical protein